MTHEQRRALEILADAGQHGATEATMLAHGFWRDMLAGLVLAGLATVVTETIRAGGPTIKVECQSASNFDPRSASNFDPLERRVRAVALAPSELVGVAETARARVGE